MKMPYLSVRTKFTISICAGLLWAYFSLIVAEPWVTDMSKIFGAMLSYFILYGIAIVPGFMNAFLVATLLMDRRPPRKQFTGTYPPITILVAAFNEESSIVSTLESIDRQQYPGVFKVVVVNDGSTDNTVKLVTEVKEKYSWLDLLDIKQNVGKANALTKALELVDTDIVITIDGDSYLFKNALLHLVERYLSDPPNTAAVAGAVLVRNSRDKFICKLQEWDYFHGIAAIKRLQSLYQGTLVAQGAFSLYKTEVVKKLGGWPHTVGEDIVLTWGILGEGHRVGYAEDACLFTNAPDTMKQFFKQRARWSRGLIEAFKIHWRLLFKRRMTTLFIWWNLLFPYMDIVFTFAFIPGLIAACFGIFWIAGPMTLIVLPLAFLVNYIMYRIQVKMFTAQGLKVRKNILGFITYALFYSIMMQPFSVIGYVKEIFNGAKKNWGTK